MKSVPDFEQMTIAEFLAQVAGDAPVLPAGGCVAALAGALGAALEQFAARLSQKRVQDPDGRGHLGEVLSRLYFLREACTELMKRDVEVYTIFIEAVRMPETTPEAQAGREFALEKALIGALGPPLTLMEYGLEMLRWGHRLILEGFLQARADSGVSLEMAHACFWGALWTARANLSRISDHNLVEQHRQRIKNLRQEAVRLYKKAREELENRL
jgi:formiminotetrahydrofolate cyclodeaminase